MPKTGTNALDEDAPPHRLRFTVEQYHRMGEAGVLGHDDRVELIDGEIIQMTPIGPPHAGGVTRATGLFSRGLAGRAEVSVQNPVVLDGRSEPQPDLALLRPKASSYADAHPRPEDIFLLVEVADTTLLYDRNVKLPRYAAAGIREVWIVDLAARAVEVYRTPEDGSYADRRVLRAGDRLSVEALPGWSFDVAELVI